MDIVPFARRFVEPAAALLAHGHHPPPAGGGPALDLGDTDVARRLLEQSYDTGPAVAAVDDGTLIGFMAVTTTDGPEQRHARIRLHQHAAERHGRRAIYRRLYAALAGRLTALGAFEHTAVVSAAHHDTLTALFELGFGADQIKGARPTSAPIRTGRDAAPPREADTGDLADLLDLTVELQRFHARSPVLRPALVDLRAVRDSFRSALADEHQLLLVTEQHGRLTGMMQAGPDSRYLSTATIGIAVVTAPARSKGVGRALLSGVVDWAARHGYETCGTEWTSANLVGDAFWRGHGFAPVGHTLTRRIDTRVSWADTGFNYRYARPELSTPSAPAADRPAKPRA
ncbi:GNAT family N-acetyltransferase [Streptomyces sp. NPDC006645]|uniref:GNAT family N-acetyltransferase n=1 Tax=unclassified Streptomyces TaxID=2593676 RepID=UPI0033A2EDB1